MFGLVGIWRYIVPGVAALALIAAIILGINSCKRIDQENKNTVFNSGVTTEREKGHEEVINHVQEARNAVDNPTNTDRSNLCTKYDRNCSNSK